MPQPQFTDFSAYEPEIERRPSLPITNLPVNAIGAPSDPTLEIRTLIEELQKAARDSARQVRDADAARDEAATRFQAAQAQIEQLKANERELRTHFIEVSAILRERDEAVQTRDRVVAAERESSRKLKEATQQVLDIRREMDAFKRSATEAAERIVEMQQQVTTIRQARDTAHAQNIALTNKTTQMENEIAELDYQRDAAELQSEKRNRELNELRGKLAALEAQLAGARNEDVAGKATLEAQIAALNSERDAATASDRAAREQAQQSMCELDLARHELAEQKARFEAELAEVRQRAETAAAKPSTRNWEADAHEAQRHFAHQRLEMIEVVTQLQAAQLQVRELSASLAEARLQVKFAHSATRGTKPQPGSEKVVSVDSGMWAAEASLTESEARGVVVAMHQCFAGFARDSRDLGLLNELHRHISRLSERARISGFIALHRHCRLFAEFTRVLSEAPEKLTESSTQTMSQTLDFLAALMRTRQLGSLRDPATARIYVVDDQPECCEAIAMMMQEQMIQTLSAQDSSCALLELASESFDLIILDVVMPDTNGFELCRRIRELPFHAATPIIFLTGMATPEAHAEFEASSGDDFVAKPFNLAELSLKVLTLMLHSQIAQC